MTISGTRHRSCRRSFRGSPMKTSTPRKPSRRPSGTCQRSRSKSGKIYSRRLLTRSWKRSRRDSRGTRPGSWSDSSSSINAAKVSRKNRSNRSRKLRRLTPSCLMSSQARRSGRSFRRTRTRPSRTKNWTTVTGTCLTTCRSNKWTTSWRRGCSRWTKTRATTYWTQFWSRRNKKIQNKALFKGRDNFRGISWPRSTTPG